MTKQGLVAYSLEEMKDKYIVKPGTPARDDKYERGKVLEKTEEGLLARPAHHIAPLKEWDKLFAAADTATEDEFNDWDLTFADGIE